MRGRLVCRGRPARLPGVWPSRIPVPGESPPGDLEPDHVQQEAAATDWLQDYAHPSRRYGLQEERLQIFCRSGRPLRAPPRRRTWAA